jgi:CheY-like chemotaxis protein
MDVRMPHLDGLQATRRIVRARERGPRVLIRRLKMCSESDDDLVSGSAALLGQ